MVESKIIKEIEQKMIDLQYSIMMYEILTEKKLDVLNLLNELEKLSNSFKNKDIKNKKYTRTKKWN